MKKKIYYGDLDQIKYDFCKDCKNRYCCKDEWCKELIEELEKEGIL